MTLTWRALTLDDVTAVSELSNTAAEADQTGEVTNPTEISEWFENPQLRLATDSISVWDGRQLLGMGVINGREQLVDGQALVMLLGDIAPTHRRQGLGSEVFSWLEDRGAGWAGQTHTGAPVRLRASGGISDSSRQRLLEHFGYRPDNYFETMELELSSWEDPGTPSVSVPLDQRWSEPTRLAHNDAFRDHRNFSPSSAQQWEYSRSSASTRPDQSRVVVQDSRVLAYALGSEDKPGVLHVRIVGTRREARGRGLARDVLVAVARAARQAGYRVCELEVDQTSPTGADRLYRDVGYRPVRVISRYYKEL